MNCDGGERLAHGESFCGGHLVCSEHQMPPRAECGVTHTGIGDLRTSPATVAARRSFPRDCAARARRNAPHLSSIFGSERRLVWPSGPDPMGGAGSGHPWPKEGTSTSPFRFTRPLLALTIGVPLAWAVLLWFHPDVDPNHVYADLREDVVAYQIVHAGTLVFIGLMGLALYLLVRDLPGQGRGSTISRLAIGPFVVFYAASGSVIGLAIGALVQHANDAPVRQRPAVADAIQSLGDNAIVGDPGIVGIVGSVAWIVAVAGGRDGVPPGWRPTSRDPAARAVLHGGLAPAADRTHGLVTSRARWLSWPAPSASPRDSRQQHRRPADLGGLDRVRVDLNPCGPSSATRPEWTNCDRGPSPRPGCRMARRAAPARSPSSRARGCCFPCKAAAGRQLGDCRCSSEAIVSVVGPAQR